MITVAIRRLDLDDPTSKTPLGYIDWNKYQILPSTAGCATVEEVLLPPKEGSEDRVGSPVTGGSTLMTSAPHPARSLAQKGPTTP